MPFFYIFWVIRPDGSIAYTNQRWRDYSQLLSHHAGERAWFQHVHADDCLRIQDRLRTLPHTNFLSEKEVWLHSLHPDDKERVLEAKSQAFATGEPYAFEYRLRDGRKGGYRWFLSRGEPLRDEAGQVVLWVVTCTDIDEQKRIEEALRQSQERANRPDELPLQRRAFPEFGMGLYIVSEIVKHHGGTIRVESEKGKGSTFHFMFPLAASREEVSRGRERKSDGQEPADRL